VKRTLLSLTLVFLLIVGLSIIWVIRDMQQYLQQPVNLMTTRNYVIQPGMNLSAVARDLEAEGILSQPLYFILFARYQGLETDLKAGEYTIPEHVTPLELLNLFVKGQVKQYSLVLIEGWTFPEVMSAIQSNPVLKQTLAGSAPDAVMAALGSPELSPEGQFFPDTYHFPRGTSDLDFLRRAHKRLQNVLIEEWRQRDSNLPYAQPYDALIMASLIEKETGLPKERGRIAGVFVRRLQKGMRLQTDPTVIFALGEEYDGNIRRRDLSIDSPYNTYRYPGLPPTPIALPGREAIHAAMHPEEGEELYGIEGAGKSTQLGFIRDCLETAGHEVLVTREPGGTSLGERIRNILLLQHELKIAAEAELMLMFAARAQHLKEIILPALANNMIVICDRFTDSSYAYQGGGRGIPMAKLDQLAEWVHPGFKPDLTFLLDIPADMGLARAREHKDNGADRFESETVRFFERVRQSFLDLAEADPSRFEILDSSQDIVTVQAAIRQTLHRQGLC